MKSFRHAAFAGCLLLAGSLLLAACGTDKAAQSGASQENRFKPTLEVKLDIQGDIVTTYVTTDLHISPEHYGQARVDGEGHIHMYLDGGEKVGVKAPKYVFPPIEKGDHTLKVSLHNNDHTPYDVTQTLKFTIE